MLVSTTRSPRPEAEVTIRRPLTRVSVRPAPRPNRFGNCWPLPAAEPLPAACGTLGMIDETWLSSWPGWTKPRSRTSCAWITATGAGVVVSTRLMREPVTTTSSTSLEALAAAWAKAVPAANKVAPAIMVEASRRPRAVLIRILSPGLRPGDPAFPHAVHPDSA